MRRALVLGVLVVLALACGGTPPVEEAPDLEHAVLVERDAFTFERPGNWREERSVLVAEGDVSLSSPGRCDVLVLDIRQAPDFDAEGWLEPPFDIDGTSEPVGRYGAIEGRGVRFSGVRLGEQTEHFRFVGGPLALYWNCPASDHAIARPGLEHIEATFTERPR